MLLLVLCSMLVSLSELFTGDATEDRAVVVDGKTPIYVAVLVTLLMPLTCTVFTCGNVKYASKYLRIDATDWNCAFNGMMFIVF